MVGFRFIKNFSYLTVFEVVRVLTPFLVYPFLVTRLGPDVFGLVIFAQTVVSYFNVIIDYGFNISAVQQVARHHKDVDKLSKIVGTVYFIKASLFLFSFVLLFVLALFFIIIRDNLLLFVLSMSFSFHETVIPIWFFQGMEKMKNISIVSFASKLIYVILVFLFIRESSDYLLVPVFNFIGSVAAAVLSVYILAKSFQIKMVRSIEFSMVRSMLKDGLPLFLSRISAVFNASFGKLVIGIVLGMDKVAVYDIAQKIVDLFKIPFSMLNQVIFPEVSRTLNMQLVKRMILVVIGAASLFILGLYFFGHHLVELVGGGALSEAVTVLRKLSPVILISGISFFLGNTVLIVKGYVKAFNISVVLGALLYVVGIGLLYYSQLFTLEAVAMLNAGIMLTILAYRWMVIKKNSLL